MSTALTAFDPRNAHPMPVVLQSTIDLLETELVRARATLQDIQPNAITAYRENLIARAPEFFYGSRRLSPKDVGLVPRVKGARPDNQAKFESSHSAVPAKPSKPVTLEDLLSNTIVLDHMAPYLSVPSLLSLASTSRSLRSLVMETPYVFRYLNLTRCHGAQLFDVDADSQWRSDSLTEDEFYSAPLAGIFASLERKSILRDVRTLVLDGLSVPADLVSEIVLTDRFNVSVLSIRECRHLNERKLMQALQYAVRPTRPKGTPKVKGVYYFTPAKSGPIARSRYRDWWSSTCTGRSGSQPATPPPEHQGAPSQYQNAWYAPSGMLLKGIIEDGWAQTIQKCEGIIAFDAVLCRGLRHNVDLYSSVNQEMPPPDGPLLGPTIATVALGPRGCDGCHSSPEGPAIWGQSPDEHFPLLSPPPLHSSSPATAKRPALFPDEHPVLISRCTDCLAHRWCHRCNKWFCNNCLPHPDRHGFRLSPHQTAVRGRRDSRSSDSSLDQTVRREPVDMWSH